MTDDEREIVRRLQAQVDAEWRTPRAIALDGPGPFELPLFGSKVSVLTEKTGQVVLELETAKESQRVRIPVSADALGPLRALINVLLQRKGEPTKQ